jgi:hypothetical protein
MWFGNMTIYQAVLTRTQIALASTIKFAIEMEYLWISDVREYTAKTIRGHTIRMTPNTIHIVIIKF